MQLSKDAYKLEFKKKRTLKLFPIRKTFYLEIPCTLFSYRFMCLLELG